MRKRKKKSDEEVIEFFDILHDPSVFLKLKKKNNNTYFLDVLKYRNNNKLTSLELLKFYNKMY